MYDGRVRRVRVNYIKTASLNSTLRLIFKGLNTRVRKNWLVCLRLDICRTLLIRGRVTRAGPKHALPQGRPIRMQGARVQGYGCAVGRCTGLCVFLSALRFGAIGNRFRKYREGDATKQRLIDRKQLWFEFFGVRTFVREWWASCVFL